MLFQECYDRSHETEIVVTLCDGNPKIKDEVVTNAIDVANTAVETSEDFEFDPSEEVED